MGGHIHTKFDQEINAFIILMPEYITPNELSIWSKKFLKLLRKWAEKKKVKLLVDTNRHQFESIECLKLLRNLLSNDWQVQNSISKVAFVQPRQYRKPEIISPAEAYFSNFEDAHIWLRQQSN
jgi:hypothetical protein